MQDISNIIKEEQLKLEEGKWLTIAEAAKYLRISKDTLRRWEKEKILKPYRSPSNHRYYQKRELDMVFTKKPEFKEEVEPKVSKINIESAKNEVSKAETQIERRQVKTFNFKWVFIGLGYALLFGLLLWIFWII